MMFVWLSVWRVLLPSTVFLETLQRRDGNICAIFLLTTNATYITEAKWQISDDIFVLNWCFLSSNLMK